MTTPAPPAAPTAAAAPAGMNPMTLAMVAGLGIQWWMSRSSEKPATERVRRSKLEQLQENNGLDPDALKRVKQWAEEYVSSKKLPGMVIGISLKGQTVFEEAVGDELSADTIMRFASMDAPVIAATLFSLIDEGKLSIDDPVSKFLPYFSKFQVFKSGTTKVAPKCFEGGTVVLEVFTSLTPSHPSFRLCRTIW
jgi:CubicO group peptidase (beta-lactamase class C family)